MKKKIIVKIIIAIERKKKDLFISFNEKQLFKLENRNQKEKELVGQSYFNEMYTTKAILKQSSQTMKKILKKIM